MGALESEFIKKLQLNGAKMINVGRKDAASLAEQKRAIDGSRLGNEFEGKPGRHKSNWAKIQNYLGLTPRKDSDEKTALSELNWDRLRDYLFSLRDHCFSELVTNYSCESIDGRALSEFYVYSNIHLRYTRAKLGKRLSEVKLYGRLGDIAALRTPSSHRDELTMARQIETDIELAKEKGSDLPSFPVHLPLLLEGSPSKEDVRETLSKGLAVPDGSDDSKFLEAMIGYHIDHCDPPKDVWADFFSVGEATFFPTWIFFCCNVGEIHAGEFEPFVDLMSKMVFRRDELARAAESVLERHGF